MASWAVPNRRSAHRKMPDTYSRCPDASRCRQWMRVGRERGNGVHVSGNGGGVGGRLRKLDGRVFPVHQEKVSPLPEVRQKIRE